VVIFIWGTPAARNFLNRHARIELPVPGLHHRIARGPEVVAPGTGPESAIYKLEWLSATGTGILVAALLASQALGYKWREVIRIYFETLVRLRFSLITIAAMLSLGYVTRYSGMDATLGLALAQTGVLYPFFGTLLGWLGVALTGSDTASNVLFGNLQTITAQKVGVDPVLMAAANSSGGVMGKMLDAQSIVVAGTATDWYGHEWKIFRFVFWHSLILAVLTGGLVLFEAWVLKF
jgi:lactate permease